MSAHRRSIFSRMAQPTIRSSVRLMMRRRMMRCLACRMAAFPAGVMRTIRVRPRVNANRATSPSLSSDASMRAVVGRATPRARRNSACVMDRIPKRNNRSNRAGVRAYGSSNGATSRCCNTRLARFIPKTSASIPSLQHRACQRSPQRPLRPSSAETSQSVSLLTLRSFCGGWPRPGWAGPGPGSGLVLRSGADGSVVRR
jgi:hypothetical protein